MKIDAPHISRWMATHESSLVALRDDVLRDVDLLYSASPGARYLCGVDMVDGRPAPYYDDFAEFDGYSLLVFRA